MKVASRTTDGIPLREAVAEAVSAIGGFGKFVKTGDVVLLKPNFNTADPYPASTDFEFLKTVNDLAYEHGAKLVIVGESCTMTMNTRKVMERLGVFRLQETDPSPRIMVFEEMKWGRKNVPGGKFLGSVSTPELLGRIDKLILLPCLKTHKYAQFTGALKLSVGFMKPVQRVRLHIRNLQEKIAELNTLIKPDFIIMDARKCFINRGPSNGKICEPGLILASDNRVAIDLEGVKIIRGYKGNSLQGIEPEDLPQIKRAVELGLAA